LKTSKIREWHVCVEMGIHSSFERCDKCVDVIEIVGPIQTGGLMSGNIYRTKDTDPPTYYRLVPS